MQQTALLRFNARCGELAERQAGSLSEQFAGDAVREAQHIHQKFEGQLISAKNAFAGAEALAAV